MLTFEQIRELIELVAENGLESVEIERSGFKVRIEGRRQQALVGAPEMAAAAPPPQPSEPASSAAAQPSGEAATEEKEGEESAAKPSADGHVVASPIVGTFYRAPNPDSDPFVRVGDRVEVGQVLCIVEAMKLMNEIESDATGVVVEVVPKNAQPVEFGEPLFVIQAD